MNRNDVVAAAARVDITPAAAYDMGSGPKKHQVEAVETVREPLEANILLFRGGKSASDAILFVSLDVLYPGETIREAIEAAVPWLDPARIVVGASHTHRAPMTMRSAPSLGDADAGYLNAVSVKLREAIIRLVDSESPAQLTVGAVQASHSINRRKWKRFLLARKPRVNFVANAPNPRGPTDETVTVVEVRDAAGVALAYLWNYACHPVSHPDSRTYSSHFPHVVREILRAHRGEPVPVLFFQGFSGNTRPSASRRVRKPIEIIRRVVSGPLFDDMSWRAYRKWAASLAERVLAAVAAAQPLDLEAVTAERRVVPGAHFADGSNPITFQSIALGDQLQLIAVSAEPVCEYAKVVRAWDVAPFMMCVGCVDTVAGYIPTQVMIEEGGYESDRSRPHFGIGAYVEGYQALVEECLREVAFAARKG